ncbi:MAG: hypothetical protein ACFHW5_07015 [Verrucomicrobiota bacterium]|jgi:hypothetical protein
MKTTLEVPDALLRDVKISAAKQGQTMGAFINAAIEEKLKMNQKASMEKPWMKFAGILKNHRTETKKILERIESECGRIDEESWK